MDWYNQVGCLEKKRNIYLRVVELSLKSMIFFMKEKAKVLATTVDTNNITQNIFSFSWGSCEIA